MSGSNADLFSDNEDETQSELNRLTDLLFQGISAIADDNDIPDEILPVLLLRLSLITRTMAYATSVARPSAGGLKLDLDRFRRDADDLIREMKKDAERFIGHAKEAIEAAGTDHDGT